MKFITKHRVLFCDIALLLCGALWGSGFTVMKNSLDSMPVNFLLAFRFTIAGILLALILIRQFKGITRKTILRGLCCGFLLYCAYSVQTYGLALTTSGKNAFLTAIYVIIVPFLYWLVYKRKPTKFHIIAAALFIVGVGVVALSSDLSVNMGDMLTLLCGVLYAAHIVAVSIFSDQGENVMLLTAMQFIFAAMFAFIVGFIFEPFPTDALATSEAQFSIAYLGIACTLLALTLQNIGLKYAPPAHASLLMSTEAPFGVLFGILFLGEALTLRFIVGVVFISVAIFISEMRSNKPAQTL